MQTAGDLPRLLAGTGGSGAGSPLTVAGLLRLPEVRAGGPKVLTGPAGLDAPVRWVHASETPDVASLSGGEIILTTGVAMPSEERALSDYVESLSAARASGLMVVLGWRYDEVPARAVRTAMRKGLPLVTLTRQTRSLAVTEAAHATILSQQLVALRHSEAVHAVFDELAIDGASPERILAAVASLLGRPAVLENLTHQVLAVHSPRDPVSVVLRDWEHRSRLARTSPGVGFARVDTLAGPESWLTAGVGVRGEQWGRVVCVGARGDEEEKVVLACGATALALTRATGPGRPSLERRSQGTLLNEIRTGSSSSTSELLVRAAAAGVPLAGTAMTAVVVRVGSQPPGARDVEGPPWRGPSATLADRVAAAAQSCGAPALVGALPGGDTALLVPHRSPAERQLALTRLARELHAAFEPTRQVAEIGVGAQASGLRDARRSLREAEHVVDASGSLDDGKLFHELADVRLLGLLHSLRSDPRVQTFVERELGALLAHDEQRSTDYAITLAAYLDAGRNKSSAADALAMSRPAFYQRLTRIEEILNVDLADMATCLSLHVALQALHCLRRARRT